MPRPRGIEEEATAASVLTDAQHRALEEQQFVEYIARHSQPVKDLCDELAGDVMAWFSAAADGHAGHGKRTPARARREMLEELGTSVGEGLPFAGRTTAENVEAAIEAGNIRERFYHLDAFLRKRFFKDVTVAPDAVFERIMAALRMVLPKATAKAAEQWMRTMRGGRGDDVDRGDRPAAATLAFKEAMTLPGTPFHERVDCDARTNFKPDYKRPGTPAGELEDEYLNYLCRQLGVDLDLPRADRVARLEAADVASLEGENHPYAWSRVKRESLSVPLTDREARLVNPVDPDDVPYIRGDYANMLREEHPWIADASNKQLPLRAGPSGTAHRLVLMLTHLGHDATVARLSVAGFLGPIHAHSCHEILFATAGIGDCRYDPAVYAATPLGETRRVLELNLFGPNT